MPVSHRVQVAGTVAALVLGAAGLMAYKTRALGYALSDVLPVRQYEVTYARPLGGSAPRKLQVSVRRNGASVIAPARAPATR